MPRNLSDGRYRLFVVDQFFTKSQQERPQLELRCEIYAKYLAEELEPCEAGQCSVYLDMQDKDGKWIADSVEQQISTAFGRQLTLSQLHPESPECVSLKDEQFDARLSHYQNSRGGQSERWDFANRVSNFQRTSLSLEELQKLQRLNNSKKPAASPQRKAENSIPF